MDSRERTVTIEQLRGELERSIRLALQASARWNQRSTDLRVQFGADTHELHIAKRDDLRLKEYMAAYVWHRDNSNWARNMLGVLEDEVSSARRVPAPR